MEQDLKSRVAELRKAMESSSDKQVGAKVAYKNMFGDTQNANVAVPRSLMFGDRGNEEEQSLSNIRDWLTSNGKDTIAPGRIVFNLNAMQVGKITIHEIGTLGNHTLSEATEASKCLEEVVTQFSDLKPYLEEPKKQLLLALELIEGETRSKGLRGLFQWKTTPKLTPVELRNKVKAHADKALTLMKSCSQYRLDPFIEGLNDAIYHCGVIIKSVDEAVATLDYVNQKSTDSSVQDLALRRKEMFNKSAMLMQMNKGQLDQMTLFCQKNKSFLNELESTIIPVLDNIMRSAVIGDVSGESMEDIATKMKELIK